MILEQLSVSNVAVEGVHGIVTAQYSCTNDKASVNAGAFRAHPITLTRAAPHPSPRRSAPKGMAKAKPVVIGA